MLSKTFAKAFNINGDSSYVLWCFKNEVNEESYLLHQFCRHNTKKVDHFVPYLSTENLRNSSYVLIVYQSL